jgi:ubiquinone/menaquinone biosynthesis C-methylase UbiE
VTDTEYRPFPDQDGRNWRQEHVEIPLMLWSLGVPRGARVLEVGCGRGVALRPLARQLAPSRLAGLDVDAALLAVARARVERESVPAELILGDVRDMPFPSGDFDVVIDFGTCFHIARPGDALREIARVIAPGGVFVTETKLSQLLSHPVRGRGRRLPWAEAPTLLPLRHALLWESRRPTAQ